MATVATRMFVTNLFTSIVETGLGETFLAALSDKVHWTATGDSPLSGKFPSKQAYIDQVLIPLRGRLGNSPKPIVDRILVDGEWAAVHFHSEGAVAKNGVDLSMQYCWLLKVQENKIVEVVGFFDQKKICDLFATDKRSKQSSF